MVTNLNIVPLVRHGKLVVQIVKGMKLTSRCVKGLFVLCDGYD